MNKKSIEIYFVPQVSEKVNINYISFKKTSYLPSWEQYAKKAKQELKKLKEEKRRKFNIRIRHFREKTLDVVISKTN